MWRNIKNKVKIYESWLGLTLIIILTQAWITWEASLIEGKIVYIRLEYGHFSVGLS